MSEKEVDLLINALENEENSSMIELNSQKIKTLKNNILQKLQLDRDKLKLYHKKLKKYRYCSDLSDLQFGNYIRWISLKDPENIFLTNGAFFTDYIFENNMVYIICKNSRNRIFRVKFDEIIIFQKLNNQENVILSVLDYLNK
tara:strand:- start:3013 stop:3441 length:429 start_codon:yes stop_codon:yes gene_type:complete